MERPEAVDDLLLAVTIWRRTLKRACMRRFLVRSVRRARSAGVRLVG